MGQNFARAPETLDTPLCVAPGCRFPGQVVPRIWVPEVGWTKEKGTDARRMFCNLPFCVAHWDADWMRANLLNDKVKAIFEKAAKARGMGRLDFDLVWFEQVDIRDPEYRAFLANLEISRHPAILRPSFSHA